MPSARYLVLIERLRSLGAFMDEAAAARVLFPALEALGTRLTAVELEALAEALPEELAQALRAAEHWTQGPVPDFFASVAAREGVSPQQAHVQAALVCRVLGEALSPDARARLVRDIPELGRLLEPSLTQVRALRLVPRTPFAGRAEFAPPEPLGGVRRPAPRVPRR
jgi:uncharacterized protein (DUF2267 family)